jgi:hypothetical protein
MTYVCFHHNGNWASSNNGSLTMVTTMATIAVVLANAMIATVNSLK